VSRLVAIALAQLRTIRLCVRNGDSKPLSEKEVDELLFRPVRRANVRLGSILLKNSFSTDDE